MVKTVRVNSLYGPGMQFTACSVYFMSGPEGYVLYGSCKAASAGLLWWPSNRINWFLGQSGGKANGGDWFIAWENTVGYRWIGGYPWWRINSWYGYLSLSSIKVQRPLQGLGTSYFHVWHLAQFCKLYFCVNCQRYVASSFHRIMMIKYLTIYLVSMI